MHVSQASGLSAGSQRDGRPASACFHQQTTAFPNLLVFPSSSQRYRGTRYRRFRPQSPLCAPPPSFQEAACPSSRAPGWDGTSGSAGKDHCTSSLSLSECPHPTPSVTIGQYNPEEGWVDKCLSFTCEDAVPPCCLTRCGFCWLKRQDTQLSGGIRVGLPWNEVSCHKSFKAPAFLTPVTLFSPDLEISNFWGLV